MDQVKPNITVSVWTAARRDCASKFQLIVKLLQKGQNSGVNFAENEPFQDGVQKMSTPNSFVFKRLEGAWKEAPWVNASHTFTFYPPGIRFIQVMLRGIDCQNWKGNYGPKVAAPSVTIMMP